MTGLMKKRILVTGGSGFLGKYVVSNLCSIGCEAVFTLRSGEYDLRDQSQVSQMFRRYKPDVVLHCAAKVGGLGLNKAKPAELFYDNIIMGVMLLEQAYRFGVEKFIQLGTICAYPKFTPTPFREEDLWNGYPEDTNAPYGISKRALITMGQSYRKQYGFSVINLLPVNLYGPGDHFDLEKCHVVPAMIRKFVDAQKANTKETVFWGTGNATREFLYVEDAARAVVLATEKYDKDEPINIGTGEAISMKILAALIASKVGYAGEVLFNSSMPEGQLNRRLNIDRAKTEFGFTATTSLSEGLDKTIAWYKENLCAE